MDEIGDIIVRDHTRLRDRDRLIWSLDGRTALPFPLHIVPMMAGGVASVILLGIIIPLTLFVPLLNGLLLIGIFVAVALGVGCGVWWAKFTRDDMHAQTWLLVLVDWVRQPKRISGLGRDEEPDTISMKVVMWEPGLEWRKDAIRSYRAWDAVYETSPIPHSTNL